MKITPCEKLDLFEMGNFIKSFDSYEDVELFLKTKLENEILFYGYKKGDRKYLAEIYNSRRYSIIKSTYFKFSV